MTNKQIDSYVYLHLFNLLNPELKIESFQKMNIRALFFICCAPFVLTAVNAQEREKKQTSEQITTHTEWMDKRVSELMADRVGFKKDMALKELAEINEKAELEARENLMFPADELYGSLWDTRWVDPYHKSNIAYPDSFAIDCASFTFPIDTQVKVTSKYGPRRRRMHKGIDLKVQTGDTIRAAFDGKVRIRNFERRGYGNYLVVRHPNGLETVYGHLSKFLVDVNQIVRAGDPIALGGNTGRSTGSHLHFETRFLGQAINPAEIIDFDNLVPHEDTYVFRNVKVKGRNSNMYTSGNNQMVYHRVKSGDTLGKIARMYGTSINELCRLNGLKSNSTLRIGQSLRCSAGGGQSVAKKNDKQGSKSVVKTTPTTVQASAAAVASLPDNALNNRSDETPVYHRIQSGDTLGAIATRYGTTVNKLCELNGIRKNTILKLGRSIRCS